MLPQISPRGSSPRSPSPELLPISPPRPVELTYAAFMKLVETRGSALTDMRISLTRITFMLDGKAAFTRPVRAPTDMIWFLHRSGVDFRAAATSGHIPAIRYDTYLRILETLEGDT